MPTPQPTTAERIRAQRRKLRWTQIELGNRAEVHPATVSYAERGAPVSRETIAKLAAALGVRAEELQP